MAKSNSDPGKRNHNNQLPVQEKVVVKKKSGCLPAFILLIVLVGLIIWLMSHFNIGFFGKESKNSSSGDTSTSDSSDTEKNNNTSDSDEQDGEKIIDITVNGNQYYYNDGKTEIDSFISELKEIKGTICVRIIDDNAYYECMQSLEEALKNADIPFTESATVND